MQGGKQMKQKRAICYSLVVVLLFSLLSLAVSFAGNDAKDKLNELTNQINKLEKQLKAGKSEEKNLASQISNLDKLIKAAEGEIRDLQGEISYASKQISNVKKELDLMQADIDRQNEEMSDRIRAMYKNGDVGMIEILLGSESIIDFMTNMDMAQKIFDNDVEVLEKLEEQHLILDGHRTQLENLQQQLLLKKQQEASKQSQLQVNRGSVAKLKAEVSVTNKTLESQVDALNAEANALTAEILRLQGSGAYIGGDMAWPAPGSRNVTSPFGYRIHPILRVKKLHTGIDIGIGSGNKIVAANAGTVIKAAWNNSYGYMVMIDHGGGIVTLYAHNSKLQVSTGDIVTRGQTVATSGSTGMSTGPHLHFEVRVNGEYKNPMSYL
jgi:murein DD-endopeptidase MepM/ murein hydrolase activator NlpD